MSADSSTFLSEPSSFVQSPLGIRLVAGLLAPFMSPDGMVEVERRWGVPPMSLFEESVAAVVECDDDPSFRIALGAWFRRKMTGFALPARAVQLLDGLLEELPMDDDEAQALLDDWAFRHTNGMISKFPGEAKNITTGALASAIVVEDEWATAPKEGRGPFKGARVEGFAFRLKHSDAFVTEDGQTAVVSLPLTHGVEFQACYSKQGTQHAYDVLTRVSPAGHGGVGLRPVRAGDAVAEEQSVAGTDSRPEVWLPEFTIENTLDIKEQAGLWGLADAVREGGLPGLETDVDSVQQAAFIEVTAAGVRAAAVTAVMFMAANAMHVPMTRVLCVTFDDGFAYRLVKPGSPVALFEGVYNG